MPNLSALPPTARQNTLILGKYYSMFSLSCAHCHERPIVDRRDTPTRLCSGERCVSSNTFHNVSGVSVLFDIFMSIPPALRCGLVETRLEVEVCFLSNLSHTGCGTTPPFSSCKNNIDFGQLWSRFQRCAARRGENRINIVTSFAASQNWHFYRISVRKCLAPDTPHRTRQLAIGCQSICCRQ